LLAAFSKPVPGTVGTAELPSFVGSGVICDAHIAAKLPEPGAAELVRPKKLEADAAATLFVIAGSMVEVTVKVRANVKAHSTWMHLVDQPRQACAGDEEKEKRQWNEAIPNFADGGRREAGVSALGKGCPTRQILTTPQIGLPQQEEVVELPLFVASRVALVFAQLVVA